MSPTSSTAALDSTIYGVTSAVPNLRRVVVDGSGTATIPSGGTLVQDYLRLHVDPASSAVFSWTRVPYTPYVPAT